MILLAGLTNGIEILNVTENLGLMPIHLSQARKPEFYHTVTHYFRTDDLLKQVNAIRSHYQGITLIIESDHDVYTTVQPKLLLVEHMLNSIEEKIRESIIPKRKRRGLINGLGSIIKFITGNLDASDEERYNEILNHLDKKQEDFSEQLKGHYSINNALMNQINSSLETINYNQDVLTKEIEKLKEISSAETQIRKVERALDHNQAMLQLLLDLAQDIDNSVTFCKLGKVHPSIIKPMALSSALRELELFYGDKIPKYQGLSLWETQTHIKVRCYIGEEEIVYFLDVPILHPQPFDLYLLQSVPSFRSTSFVTIIPSSKYALKSQQSNEVTFFNEECEPGPTYSLCPNNLKFAGTYPCETEVLLKGQNNNCDLLELEIDDNRIEYLDQAKEFLVIFPQQDQLQLQSAKNVEFRNLQGIFLVRPEANEIRYKNQTLAVPSTNSSYNPTLIYHTKTNWEFNKEPKHSIKLKSVALLSSQNYPIPPYQNPITHIVKPSIWTIILYGLLISLVSYTMIKYYRHKRKLNVNPPTV